MKKFLNFNIITLLCLPILFIVAVKFMVINFSGHTICIFKMFTGHDCWGCGMTRAFNELFNFNFYGAYQYNPRIVIVAPLMFYIWLHTLYRELKQIHNISEQEQQ